MSFIRGFTIATTWPAHDPKPGKHVGFPNCLLTDLQEAALSDIRAPKTCEEVRPTTRRLGRRHPRDRWAPARDEEPSLLCERDVLGPSTPHTKVVPPLVERRAEACRQLEPPETQHPVKPLLDWPMVLLCEVVQVLAASVQHLPPQDPPNRLAVGRMMVRGDAQRLATGDLEQASEEAAGPRACRAAR